MNDNMVRKIYTALLGLIVLVVIASAASAYLVPSSPGAANTPSGEDILINTIQVSGTGTVSMLPDEAIVYLGVQTQSEDAETAQQTNADTMEAIIKALQDAGIADEDMKTSNYYMRPVRDYESSDNKIIGYKVSNQLEVTVKDINKTGEIIDTAVEAGANEVRGVSFSLSDEKQLDAREQALENAVHAAKSDADVLASALNITILGPVEVTTGGGHYITPYMMKEIEVDEDSGTTTPIIPGDVGVSAYVQVIYLYE